MEPVVARLDAGNPPAGDQQRAVVLRRRAGAVDHADVRQGDFAGSHLDERFDRSPGVAGGGNMRAAMSTFAGAAAISRTAAIGNNPRIIFPHVRIARARSETPRQWWNGVIVKSSLGRTGR